MTPFTVLYGREATTIIDIMFLYDDDQGDDTTVDQFIQRAEEARRLLRLRIIQPQRTDAFRYDLHCHHVLFTRGDCVWVWTPVQRIGRSTKLLGRYFVPYKVLRQLRDFTYEVVPDSAGVAGRRRSLLETVRVARMKPYASR